MNLHPFSLSLSISCVMVSPRWGEQCPWPWPSFLCPTLVWTSWTPSASSPTMPTLRFHTTPSLPWAWWAAVSRDFNNPLSPLLCKRPVLRIFFFFLRLFSPGTNNARLAAMLRQLAQYHAKDPNNLFMVRLAQVGAIVNEWVLRGKEPRFWRPEANINCPFLCLRRVWLTWAKEHWHSVPTTATGSWWVRWL